jgi:hypothetical protein
MPNGYHGCYLRIDVSSGHAERVPLSEEILRHYIGGSGLGGRLLLGSDLDYGAGLADRQNRSAAHFRIQSARRQPAHDVRQIRRGQPQSADRPLQ